MGLFDKLKEKGRGIVTAAKPDEGVAALGADQVEQRLLGISGKGMETNIDDGEVVIAWSAKVAGSGVGGAGYEFLYRAIRIRLDQSDHSVSGICLKTTTEAEISPGATFAASKTWEKGQHVGSEKLHVLAWLGPHQTEGGADEKGYSFSWSDLRDPVIDAVTGAGWTYKPRKF